MSYVTETRIPPHNLDTERAILGTFLLCQHGEYADRLTALIGPEDLYDPAHSAILSTLLEMIRAEVPTDPMTIIDWLGRKGLLEKCGGPAYITGLEQYVQWPDNVLFHARAVREKSALRKLIRLCMEVSDEAYSEHDPRAIASKFIAEAERVFLGLADSKTVSFDTLAQETWQELLAEIEKPTRGIETGIPALDDHIGGWFPGDFVIIAGTPGAGKTAIMLQSAAAAAKAGHAIIFVSLEMSKGQLMLRIAAGDARKELDIRKRTPNERELTAIAESIQGMTAWASSCVLDRVDQTTPECISAIVGEHAKRGKCQLVFVDYLQLLESPRQRNESREQELARISRSMKRMARQHGVCVIAASQVGREGARSTDALSRPGSELTKKVSAGARHLSLFDLRGSGMLEADADIVLALNLMEKGRWSEESRTVRPSMIDLDVLKHRHGRAFDRIELCFFSQIQRFERRATGPGI